MNIFRKNRSARSLMRATGLGLALSVLLSLIVILADAISERPGAGQAGDSAIVSTATAAVPATDMLAAGTPVAAGADSGLDEFRLDRDSCCINQY